MRPKTWILLLLCAAGTAAASAAEPGAIWWAAKDRFPSGGGKASDAAAPPSGYGRPERPDSQGAGASKRSGNMPEGMKRKRGMRRGGGGPPGAHPEAKSSSGKPSGDRPMPSRGEMMNAMRRPTTLLLRWGEFPSLGDKTSPVGRLVSPKNMEAWVRSPDGLVTQSPLTPEGDTVAAKCPPEAPEGAENPNGVYMTGMHLDGGVMDFDADGKMERVHFYANGLAARFALNGAAGKMPDVLFRDAGKIALEIGPITSDTGPGGLRGTSQTAMEENKLQVLFKGQPLANAQVTVLSDSGWRNRLATDAEGVLSVAPVGKKSDGRMRMTPADKCLYVVLHKEPSPGRLCSAEYAAVYHCASLLMDVRTPPPEWSSKAEGFSLVAASSIGLLVLAGTFAIYRRNRRGRQIMVAFDRRRIPEE